MGTGQIILLIGGLLLLVILSLTFFSSYRTHSDLSINSEALTTAVTIGQSMINLVQSRAFDEKTISQAVYSVDSLTLKDSFGPEAGETTVTQFDDVNDFDNYECYDTLDVFGIFKTRVTVNYVTKMNPDVISAGRTFTKIVDVVVTNQYLADTLKLKHVVTY
jgi:hypothetical protein